MIGTESVTVTPRTGAWTAGTFVATSGTPYTVTASVQPAGPRAVEMLPEGARSRARFTLWIAGTTQQIKVASTSTGAPGDVLTIRGRKYLALSVEDQSGHAHGLPHQVVVVAEVGEDETAP